MSFKLVSVGIADLKVASPPDILRTILGSCVGICCYDPETRIAGLAHIMLPSITEDAQNRKKYADTAIPLMIEMMQEKGADSNKIFAKIVGGASMFKLGDNRLISDIGKNNIIKVKEVLKEMNIEIISEDTGGDFGRTIDFYTEDGKLKVKAVKKKVKII